MSVEKLIVDHMETWTPALQTRSTAGRGSSGKIDLYGIKKLRELILELAVRGKLVPQDPNDEPASELLKRIEVEKAVLVKQGKIKKQKPLPEISEEEKPFELPEGWEWATLTRIAEINPKIDVSDDEQEISFIPMPLISTKFDGSHEFEIKKWKDVKKGYTHFANGDIAIAKITPCFENSKAAIFSGLKNGIGVGTTELHVARPFSDIINRKYLLLNFKSPNFLKSGESQMTGSAGQKRVPRLFFENNPIPFPPLQEQERIIIRFTQLMSLCDQLEQQSLTSLDAHQQLVETLLGTLADSQNTGELAENWARISEHFDTLFTTEASVDALKQTILQLAVMGKLVPQDPNDEPAENLFNRLCITRNLSLQNQLENKEADIMLRKIKKQKLVTPPFKLPENWICTNLIEICEYLVDCHNKTAPYVDAGIPIIRTTNIRNRNFQEQDLKFVNKETYEFWSRRCAPQPGDIIFTREAPMGEALIIPPNVQWCLGQRTMLIRVMHEFISNEFILLALTEPLLLERASKHAVGLTVKHLRVGDVETLNIPLPPLNEQYRIVAKVKILLSLCDKAQKKIKSAQQTQLHLADALTEAAIN
ncbi:restriction endonuclease subunit S [Escherichia coli]|uniref:Restriction endonuclease subunit S n=3 Tax=Escherichia coli TaxID=562 RepID=A0A828PAK2_ECOLX|nr:restriction endonuclease subunit S [Escherichia coli]EEV7677225.1 restriction endonuclease subunit S [Escherichia coli]EFF0583878.1 restriction endonuclease subunit S [Escherichia coli]EFI8023252.1 restriction endonuclease subunit S [Escherichia coli]EFM8155265.1 restriction endonuclease subunit S [Escherichia coli]